MSKFRVLRYDRVTAHVTDSPSIHIAGAVPSHGLPPTPLLGTATNTHGKSAERTSAWRSRSAQRVTQQAGQSGLGRSGRGRGAVGAQAAGGGQASAPTFLLLQAATPSSICDPRATHSAGAASPPALHPKTPCLLLVPSQYPEGPAAEAPDKPAHGNARTPPPVTASHHKAQRCTCSPACCATMYTRGGHAHISGRSRRVSHSGPCPQPPDKALCASLSARTVTPPTSASPSGGERAVRLRPNQVAKCGCRVSAAESRQPSLVCVAWRGSGQVRAQPPFRFTP